MKLRIKISIFTAICLLTMLFAGMGSPAFADAASGMVAHYTFDDNLLDTSGNGNDGTAVGNISFIPGPVGKAAVFDGKGYIEVKDSDSLDLGSNYSFSVWLFDNDSENWKVILQKRSSFYNEYQAAYTLVFNGMEPLLTVCQSDGSNADADSYKKIDCHQWYLLTVVSDGSSVKFYRNGELFASQEVPDGIVPDKSNGKLQIGFGHTTDDEIYTGRMDDLRIYNRLLSQEEIKKLYSDAAAGAGKDLAAVPNRLVAYYNFNNDFKDYSGYGNDGQIVGSNVKLVDSIASKGAYFGGSGYIEVKDSDSLEITRGFTASAWLKLDGLKTEQWAQPVLSRLKSSINSDMHSYDFYINSSYTPLYMGSFNFNSFTTGGWNTSDAREIMGPSVWSMITMVYDGTNVKYYKDGKLANSYLDGDGGDISHSMGKLQIGHLIDRGNEYFTKGVIDELRIYNYALSDKDVGTLFTYRDGLTVTPAAGSNLGGLKAKQSVQLSTSFSTYVFTPSPTTPGTGKSEFKLTPLAAAKVTFKSSAPKVATVNAAGKITALKKGTAFITVTYGQLSKSISVVVK